MEILLKTTRERTLMDVDRDLYWYDPDQKKMLHFRGGELKFSYDPQIRKNTPYAQRCQVWARQNNYSKLADWVLKNQERFNLTVIQSAKGYSILIDVPDNFSEDVLRDLYINKIIYD